MSRRLLVSSAGAGSAHAVIAAARRVYGTDVHIVGMDINPAHLIAATPLLDRVHRVPRSDDPGFRDAVLDIVRAERIDRYVALLDHERSLGARWEADGDLGPTTVSAPGPDAAAACGDKLATARWRTPHGLDTPDTRLARDWPADQLPAFTKPRQGIGSIGARLIETHDELAGIRDDDRSVVQTLCAPPEVTVDVFRSSDGRVVAAVCRERLETKAGVCTKARVFHDDALQRIARVIGDGLDLRGAFCFQAMRDAADEHWLVTDVNARPGAGSPMSAAAGFDTVGAMLVAAFDGRVASDLLATVAPECYVTRFYDHVVQRR